MVIAVGFHLFPFRTEKLSPLAPMVLQCGRVGRRLLSMKSLRFRKISEAFLFIFIGIFLHRISRMNRKAILLIGLLTDFRGYLAAGQWLAPEMGSYCFCHADFADDADFFIDYFVPQISRIYTDFFSLIIFLMDLHGFSLVLFFPCHFFFFCHFFISQILDLSVMEDDADFL